MLRGGAYKPRTSPYEFQGLGIEALKILREARELTGLPVVTEVMSTEDVDLICEYADMLQVGARNMQNFALLRRLATVKKPILLKRGPSATVKEWLLAAEYLLSGGNDQVALCERGIKTFETATRNTFDSGRGRACQRTLALAGGGRSVAWHRQAEPDRSGLARGHRRRCRWHHRRGPSLPGTRALRRTPVSRSSTVRAGDAWVERTLYARALSEPGALVTAFLPPYAALSSECSVPGSPFSVTAQVPQL
jgi:hypothetical protein